MPVHYNPSIAEDALRLLNTKNGNHLSNLISDVISPVLLIERYNNIVRSATATTTGTTTVYTTPSDKDFYLNYVQINVEADVTSDLVVASVYASIENVNRNLIEIRKLTTTVRSDHAEISFSKPIKVDRGSVIGLSKTFTVGAGVFGAIISGYTVETTK